VVPLLVSLSWPSENPGNGSRQLDHCLSLHISNMRHGRIHHESRDGQRAKSQITM
jgi:hypothetical protein